MSLRRNMNRVTLKDVASRCGYSANTVSRALRGDELLSEKTRKQIINLAHEMGYVPNSSACTLRLGNSGMIAVVINDINNPYYTNIVSEIDQYVSEKQYKLMILPCRDDEEITDRMIRLAISQCVDGIIFFPYNNKAHIRLLQKSDIPFVILDRWLPGIDVNVVRMNDEAGGYAAAECLLQLGHRKILYIAGPNVNSSQTDRQKGIERALLTYGLEKDQLDILPWEKLPDGIRTTDYSSLFDSGAYSAVIAYNDYIAYHCMNDLRAHGISIPEDIALIGFDYIRRYNSCFPPLTSVSTDGEGVSKVAAELLIRHMLQAGLPKQEIVLPVSIHHDGTIWPVQNMRRAFGDKA